MDDLERAAWHDQPLTHIQKARSLEAARQIQSGEVQIPLACGHCNNQSVIEERQPLSVLVSYDPDALNRGSSYTKVLRCLACGRLTSVATAHVLRRQKIVAFIRNGVDINVRNPKPSATDD